MSIFLMAAVFKWIMVLYALVFWGSWLLPRIRSGFWKSLVVVLLAEVGTVLVVSAP